MKLLIFGAGDAFKGFYTFNIEYWKTVEICAILDNDKKKWGKNLYGFHVDAPSNLTKYCYDIILICSIYDKEIRKQLLFDFHVDESRIDTRRGYFENYIFPWYKAKLFNKNVLIVGQKGMFNTCSHFYYSFFHVVGFVPYEERHLCKQYDYDYILLAFYKMSDEAEIQTIEAECDIERERILSSRIYTLYRSHISRFSYGEKYPDKRFMKIVPHYFLTGLATIVFHLRECIEYALRNDYIPVVDMQNYRNQYLEDAEIGSVNAWEKFFEQPGGYGLKDLEQAKNVFQIYYGGCFWESKYESDAAAYLPKMKQELQKKYQKFLQKFHNKRVLGVLFRGTDYSNNRPQGQFVQPDLECMIQTVKEKLDEWGEIDLIYLCTEVQEACGRFEKEFGEKVCYYPQLRFNINLENIPLSDFSFGVPGERTRRGEDYWIALNLLAACNALVAGKCGGSLMALELNKGCYENVYMFDLGRYS